MSNSLLERQSTFGASSLAQMTRGNKIPNIPANSSVPTSLPISLTQIANAIEQAVFTASASPSRAGGSRTTAGTATTGSTTASFTGGSGTLVSSTWYVTTTTGNTVTANSPNSLTTTFSAVVNGANDVAAAGAYCTLVDSSGNTANTNTVNVDLSYTGP